MKITTKQVVNQIITEAMKHRFNSQVISTELVDYSEDKRCVLVVDIFGYAVDWALPPFQITDVYKYFAEIVAEDIEDKLFGSYTDITEYSAKHSPDQSKWMKDNIVWWMKDNTLALLHGAWENTLSNWGVDWNVFFNQCIGHMAEEGLLHPHVKQAIIAGYIEGIIDRYIQIDLTGVNYSEAIGQWKSSVIVEFNNGTKIKTEGFDFIGGVFFSENSRVVTTDEMLIDLKVNVLREVFNDVEW